MHILTLFSRPSPISKTSPEARLRALEEKIHRFMEESAVALQNKDLQLALQKAKDSEVHERDLAKQRESLSGADQINFELTYAVSHLFRQKPQRFVFPPNAISLTAIPSALRPPSTRSTSTSPTSISDATCILKPSIPSALW